MEEREFSIGVDIGGTNTLIGLVSNSGEVLHTDRIRTKDYSNAGSFLSAIIDVIQPLLEQYGRQSFQGIGIGAPNANFYTGCIESAANLPWKGTIPIRDFFSKALELPVVVTNDANAAAIGEKIYGLAQGKQNFIMLTLGTGVGSGIISNGRLLYGHNGMAGEIGHVVAVRDGRPCGCGRKGCLETYASVTGIITTAITFLQQEKYYQDIPETYLLAYWKKNQTLTGKMVYAAAEAGDPLARKVFDFTGRILGQTMADVAAILAPEVFVLFGGLTAAGNWIMEPMRIAFEEQLLAGLKGNIELVFSELSGSEAAILGAAALVNPESGGF